MSKKEFLRNDLSERIESDAVETTMTADEIINHAFLLTQYERNGFLGHDELTEYIVNEIMDDPSIADINDYLSANNYSEYFEINSIENLNEALQYEEPAEIVRMSFYGDYKYNDDYFYFNGCGNLASCDEDYILDMYGKDAKRYIINNDNAPYGSEEYDICENAEIILEYANKLLESGY